MLTVLDDAALGRLVLSDPEDIITANRLEDVASAWEAIKAAHQKGRFVAGWLSYELGYALETRLVPLLPTRPHPPLIKMGVYGAPAAKAPVSAERFYISPLIPEWSDESYADAFARVRAYVEAGDIYQANISFRGHFAVVGDTFALYESLRKAANAGHCAYVDDGERQILSLSPELFFAMSADGRLSARPMKGTAPRVGDDAKARVALASSPKDRAENLMIVDLIRNDLGRVAEIGSVKVDDLFKVETYPTLHTMVSTISARKRPGTGLQELVQSLFPCGSVTGAPKIRAMEIISEVETSARGVYCGSIGAFMPDGSARFNVAIRTVTVTAGRGELGIGGAVTYDSQTAAEYAECLLKSRFLDATRRPLALIETLRFDGEFHLLDRHLARMQDSANVFGITFAHGRALQSLQHAVAGQDGPLRVRLTLDESGIFNASAVPLAATPPHWTFQVATHRASSKDALLRHKTNWREDYERALAQAGTDEVIFLNEQGQVTEGARSNIFIARDGILLTPPAEAGLLGGCLRAQLLCEGRAREAAIVPADLMDGTVLFGNSLRGLIPARRIAN